MKSQPRANDEGVCLACGTPVAKSNAVARNRATDRRNETDEAMPWSLAMPASTGPLCRSCLDGATPTPCIRRCQLDPQGSFCLGCRRTSSEITSWVHYDAQKRAEVYLRLASRDVPRG